MTEPASCDPAVHSELHHALATDYVLGRVTKPTTTCPRCRTVINCLARDPELERQMEESRQRGLARLPALEAAVAKDKARLAGLQSIPPRPVNHPLHIGLCIVTGGLWLIVYGFVLIQNGRQTASYRRYLATRG